VSDRKKLEAQLRLTETMSTVGTLAAGMAHEIRNPLGGIQLNASCLTQPQITALKALYAGSHTADGTPIYPGGLPGAELGEGGWSTWITGTALGKSLMFAFGPGFFSNMVYSDPKWDFHTATLDDAYAKANQATAASLNATDPNLKPFFDRGGKLILFHGWNDPAISPLSTIDYYTRMAAATAPQAEASTRLYLVPGMQHCIGGTGATFFGQLGWFPKQGPDDTLHDVGLALEDWVIKGSTPEALIATQYKGGPEPAHATMTRPLCPYPQSATYNGTGDPTTAASFTCTAAAK